MLLVQARQSDRLFHSGGMEDNGRMCMALLLVVCAMLPRAGAGVDSPNNSTVTPLGRLPQVTVDVKVLKRNESEAGDGQQDMAVLGMSEGGSKGNRSFVWGRGSQPLPSPPPASSTSDIPSRHLPLPIVTVASRLLYSPGRKEREREVDSSSARNSFSGDIPMHKIQFEPVPDGDVYRTDKTHAQSSVLAWAGSFVSLLQPASVPLGGYLRTSFLASL